MYTAISLGETCQTRFQVIRHLFFRMYPLGTNEQFRKCVHLHEQAIIRFGSHIFDWQITPFNSLCEYLERDFHGIFEYDDLRITGNSDNLRNIKFDTAHPHAIHPRGLFLTQEELDGGYLGARQKVQYLVDKFRNQLQSAQPRIYIYNRIPGASDAFRLVNALKKIANHPFRILFYGPDAENIPGLAGNPLILAVERSERVNKPENLCWEGDDDAWEAVLSEIPIRIVR